MVVPPRVVVVGVVVVEPGSVVDAAIPSLAVGLHVGLGLADVRLVARGRRWASAA